MNSTDPARRILIAGDRALLVELRDLDAALGLHRSLRALLAGPDAIRGIVELVPAARTVLVRFDPGRITRAQLSTLLDELPAAPDPPADTPESVGPLEIPVVYDGADLAEVADGLGISVEEVVRRHTGAEYTMAFAGFTPGFGYLVGGDPLLDVPRRTAPRVRIPAGSVGLAGRLSGVYPRQGPGGWQLIGTTTMPMWDLDRDPPAAVRPGDRVRFVAVSESPAVPTPPQQGRFEPSSDGPALIVDRPGVRTLLQDTGREGHAEWGVSGSGALDVPALRTANRLVGNADDIAALEILLGRFRARARGRVTLAVAGAPVPVTVTRTGTADTAVITDCRPIALEDGDLLTLGAQTSGLRTMLAVRGGFDVAPVLGSLSTDTLSGLGPPPIARGDVLAVHGADRGADRSAISAVEAVAWQTFSRDELEVPVVLGPRDDWFDADSIERLTTQPWTVTTDADRVGIRLSGQQPLVRTGRDELPSEGVVTGAVQVPPNGRPIVFLADHPLTGGYPVIAVVHSSALHTLAQVTPGMTIRFVLTGSDAP